MSEPSAARRSTSSGCRRRSTEQARTGSIAPFRVLSPPEVTVVAKVTREEYEERILLAQMYIWRHLDEPLCLDEIAKAVS